MEIGRRIAHGSKRCMGSRMERSPLALPFPDLPAIAGVTPRIARARYKTWDRCDLTFVTLDAGHQRRRSAHAEPLPLARGRMVPQGAGARPGARAGGQCRQLQRLHRRSRPRSGREHRRARRGASRLRAVGRVRRLDRRDRRAAADRQEPKPGSTPPSLPSRAAGRTPPTTIMTTDTFAKAAVTHCGGRRPYGQSGRHHQGIGDDRARHGDDARLHLHRCRGRARAFCSMRSMARMRKSFSCITVDSDTSTSDTVLAFATGKAGNAPLASIDDSAGADAFRAALADLCHQLAHARRARRRRRAEIDRDHREGAEIRSQRPPHRACRSPIRRW